MRGQNQRFLLPSQGVDVLLGIVRASGGTFSSSAGRRFLCIIAGWSWQNAARRWSTLLLPTIHDDKQEEEEGRLIQDPASASTGTN